ncbi:MAG: RnfABCDGE type electron transport complex subunit D [Candidatus Aenigmarchaeota archaeon]|nr:RnfABCDGE type electron transport complex subunit D [Candidatus Aenigmarchaeota archaeon]
MFDIRKVNVYYYTIFALIVTAASSLFFIGFSPQFIIPLLLIPSVTGVTDLILKSIRFHKLTYSPSAGITGLILAMVLPSLAIYQQIIVGLVAILQKHLIRHDNRHIFNPAAFGLLFAWFVFKSPPAWWAVATPAVFLFLFSDYLIGRLTLSFSFYLVSTILISAFSYFTEGVLSNVISYPLLFFAMVMVVEPRTSAITKKGMFIEGILLASGIFAIQQFLPVDVFVPILLLMNLLIHFRILK